VPQHNRQTCQAKNGFFIMTTSYPVPLTKVQIDLIYELARDAANSLPDPYDQPEPGSWADHVQRLDEKFTTLRRRNF